MEASSVEGVLERDGRSMASSPSGSSMISDVDLDSSTRQSPFAAMVASSSPSSPFPRYLQRSADFQNSMEGNIREEVVEELEKYRSRRRKHENSSSSDSDSESTVGAESICDSEDGVTRKKSKDPPIRPIDVPRCRVANIRRESNCGLTDEMAHERLVKASQQVSTGFDEFKIDEASTSEETRKRTPSLSEPISILTNPFLPHSCSPSPTRMSDSHKQCYSPSTQQVVRNNMPYSPSPSPTQSPTRKRLLSARSLSPIASRSLKRRCGDILAPDAKRACPLNFVRNSTSPLVEPRTPFSGPAGSHDFTQPTLFSSTSTFYQPKRPSFLVDPEFRRSSVDSYSDDQRINREELDSISGPPSVQMPPLDDSVSSSDIYCPTSTSDSFSISSPLSERSTPLDPATPSDRKQGCPDVSIEDTMEEAIEEDGVTSSAPTNGDSV